MICSIILCTLRPIAIHGSFNPLTPCLLGSGNVSSRVGNLIVYVEGAPIRRVLERPAVIHATLCAAMRSVFHSIRLDSSEIMLKIDTGLCTLMPSNISVTQARRRAYASVGFI